MLIHGKLHLTSSGLNLDEVRSLLQKSLRRKERDLVLQSCKELIGRGKDQLPWKSLVTFLYEDHCLSDADVVRSLWRCYKEGAKYKAVELLLKAYTARHAACLPVIALRDEYHPSKGWDATLTIDEELKGLVTKKAGCIDFDLLLVHFRKAWVEKNERDLIACAKLASMVQDYEGRSVTAKGLSYLISGVACPNRAKGKPTPGLVILSLLYKTNTTTPEMKQYLLYSFKLASLPDVCVRLVVCSAVTQLVHQDKVKKIDDMNLAQIKWKEVGKLPKMPDWAVDKHTHRGKTGRATRHLVKDKRNPDMTDEDFEHFHGERRKRGLKDFFDEGTIMNHQSCPGENPYWEETKKIYYEQPPKLQKTYRLTVIYYQRLNKENKELMYKSGVKSSKSLESGNETDDEDVDSVDARILRKRATPKVEDKQNPKRRKLDISKENRKEQLKKTLLKGYVDSGSDSESDFVGAKPKKITAEATTSVAQEGPLLQLPTGSAKVYTRLSPDQSEIWKGPYKRDRMNLVLFFHKALKDVLGDPHTLQIECQEPYLVFPTLKAASVKEIKITKRDYMDVISKTEVRDGEFVLRESLGVVQCHKVGEKALAKFPASFWVHFVWRFCLNVGDTGMYNAITDNELSFLFGIDMEERRKRVAESSLVGYMFSKAPSKSYVKQIWLCLKNKKSELVPLVNKQINYAGLDKLAAKYKVSYDRTMFIERIKLVRQAVHEL